MSTYDVPGYRAENRDQLAVGCWAENPDGSLIVVGSVDNGFTRYLVFDTSESPPIVFADAMSEPEFMRKFSLGASVTSAIPWLWHDKTPFDWARLMSVGGSGESAREIAAELGLAAHRVRPELIRRLVASTGATEGNRSFIEAFDGLVAKAS